MQHAARIATSTTRQNLQTAIGAGPERYDYLLLQAPPANSTNVLFGTNSNEIFHLEPGEKILLPAGSAKNLWLVAASGTPSVNVGFL